MSKKQVILLAGGTGGIGRTIIELLSTDHKIVVLGRNFDKLESLRLTHSVEVVVGDLNDFTSLNSAVAQVMNHHGQIDVAINSVGVLLDGSLDKLEPYEIEKVIQTNLLGAIYFSKAVLPRMKQLRQGKVIHLVSQASLVGRRYRTVYNASKWGLRGFCLSLQEEVAKYGIAITQIHPGLVNTDLLRRAGVDPEPDRGLSPQEVAKAVKFVVEADPQLTIPEIGVRSLRDYSLA